ncbi:nucleotide pyrophosphohydrolase [Chloroflexota bacterium]
MNDSTTTIGELKEQVKKFVTERDWIKYHTPKNLSMSIAIEAAELMELYQWTGEVPGEELANEKQTERLEEELADVIIYCMSFANTVGIDVATAVADKLLKNNIKYPVEKVKGKYVKYDQL